MSNYKNIIFVFITLLVPLSTHANYFTLPVDVNPLTEISSWFDHNGDSFSSMENYRGEVYSGAEANLNTCSSYFDGAGCYDNHNGIDFEAASGTDALAAADGEVEELYFNTCGGWTMRIWHNDIELSTLYAHIATTTVATTSDPVSRGDHVAEVNSTGSCATGPHLHFGVADGNSQGSNRIDPYGWWATTTDPWPYNRGYLWTTYPPSFDLATTAGSVSVDTTWRGNHVVNGNITIPSGVTLTIAPGSIIKFDGASSGIEVEGILNVMAATTSPIYMTSFKDDNAGGDTNGDATSTSPAAGDWKHIKVNSGGVVNMDHTYVKYAGGGISGASFSNIYNLGGILNFFHSTSTYAYWNAIRVDSGTTTIVFSDIGQTSGGIAGIRLVDASGPTTIASSTIHDNPYGISLNSSGAGSLTMNGNIFSNNDNDGYLQVHYAYPYVISHSGNTAGGTSPGFFEWSGSLAVNHTLVSDGIIDVISSEQLGINSGKTLTINPGTIIKFKEAGSAINVDGALDVQGSTSSPIYFTSFKDDTVGGDTNGDSNSTSPSAGDWLQIKVNSTGDATFNHAIVRYGGSYCCSGSESNVYNNQGTLTFTHSTSTTATANGIRILWGTNDINYSDLTNNSKGIYILGNPTHNIINNNIHGNSSYGLHNDTSNNITAENNYWGNSSGPYNSSSNPSGTGDGVSNFVDFDPWMTSWP